MKNLILHLRLNISIILAPIFLWGFYLKVGEFNAIFFWGFIAFHIFLYGGSNAFNSYYDKDEGPIGGLKNPPKVTKELLKFSIGCKIIGLIISMFLNEKFFALYFLFAALSIIYSHPYKRWKASPYFSIFTIGVGQGGIAFLAGYFCQTIEIKSFPILIFGMFTTIFMSMAMYPLTQLYQVEEDRKRNDITFAVYWGIKNSFKFSYLCIIISCLSMLLVLYLKSMYLDLGIISAFYAFFIIQIFLWSKNFEEKEIMKNYKKIMNLNYSNALGFIAYILIHVFKLV